MDRNWYSVVLKAPGKPSLSARRAWIEIIAGRITSNGTKVALRKESVDRNEWIKEKYPGCRLSLSARRAWIEMHCVSLIIRRCSGRSPQGERG